MNTKIEFTRIKNDVNGNPRYVCHFYSFLSIAEQNKIASEGHGLKFVQAQYAVALQKARTIGGKKFDNKQYGGGIVLQSFNIADTERQILALHEN